MRQDLCILIDNPLRNNQVIMIMGQCLVSTQFLQSAVSHCCLGHCLSSEVPLHHQEGMASWKIPRTNKNKGTLYLNLTFKFEVFSSLGLYRTLLGSTSLPNDEHWSSGYWRRLVFKRLQVWIPMPDTSSLIFCIYLS